MASLLPSAVNASSSRAKLITPATTLATIQVHAIASSTLINTIPLPRGLTGPVVALQWSPSSRHLLLALSDQILVFAARPDHTFRASIRNPVPANARLAFVGFGASDAEICLTSTLGLTLAVCHLGRAAAVEIANPKFYSAAVAHRAFSFRPRSRHLAVLTRANARDAISVHAPVTRDLERSWHPPTVDAHALAWSPNGRWLIIREAPAHSHRVLFYTPDGHLFKSWRPPYTPSPDLGLDLDLAHQGPELDVGGGGLGPGVKIMQASPDSRYLALGDSSRSIRILDMSSSITDAMTLHHPGVIVPRETCQIWQEQAILPLPNSSSHSFIPAAQAISPPPPPSTTTTKDPPSPKGISLLTFHPTLPLLATRLDDWPTTLWIWDLGAAHLRAALLFHAPVSSATWHPERPDTIMVQCLGHPSYHGLVFVWEAAAAQPHVLDFARHYQNQNQNQNLGRPAIGARAGAHWVMGEEGEEGEEALAVGLADGEAGVCLVARRGDAAAGETAAGGACGSGRRRGT